MIVLYGGAATALVWANRWSGGAIAEASAVSALVVIAALSWYLDRSELVALGCAWLAGVVMLALVFAIITTPWWVVIPYSVSVPTFVYHRDIRAAWRDHKTDAQPEQSGQIDRRVGLPAIHGLYHPCSGYSNNQETRHELSGASGYTAGAGPGSASIPDRSRPART